MSLKKITILGLGIAVITVMFYGVMWLWGVMHKGEADEMSAIFAVQAAAIFSLFMFGILVYVVKHMDD